MTKTELVDKVAEALAQSRTEAQKTLETVLDKIADGLTSDKKVQIQGFGTFFARTRKARMGRNPQTKEPMQIPASKTVTFKPGQDLKNRL